VNHGPGRVGVLEQCPEREPVGVLGRPGTLGRAGNPITLADRARARGRTASRESWRCGGAG